jgi:UTP--glucose-1-phosphate uridylyltransferase
MSFVRQMAPLGLGHAVWCARDIVGDEPFAVMLPDMVMSASAAGPGPGHRGLRPEGRQHRRGRAGPRGHGPPVRHRGAGRPGRPPEPHDRHGREAAKGTEPSNLFISGRYILQPEIFDLLEKQGKGAGGEIQLTDSMLSLLKTQDFHALEYEGETYDCGDKIGLLRANVALALKRPDLADAAREMIKGADCTFSELRDRRPHRGRAYQHSGVTTVIPALVAGTPLSAAGAGVWRASAPRHPPS